MIGRRFLLAIAAAAALAGMASAQPLPAPPSPLVYYAGAAGRLTQDRDRQGGNPFASALVEVLEQAPLTLEDFGAHMAAANARYSGGWHQLQMPRKLPEPQWRIDDAAKKRVALVLINADYSKSGGVYSLPGAAFDAQRVPKALIDAGFETMVVLDQNGEAARKALADFAKRSETADASLVYVGGHGIQHKRVVYWMMGDYPEQSAKWLASHAISLDEIGRAGRARDVNLVLYASCRDDPFIKQ
jgi:hypothetical protein